MGHPHLSVSYCRFSIQLDVVERGLAAMRPRWLLIDLSLQRHRFDPRRVHVGFAMDKLKLNRFFLKYSTFSP